MPCIRGPCLGDDAAPARTPFERWLTALSRHAVQQVLHQEEDPGEEGEPEPVRCLVSCASTDAMQAYSSVVPLEGGGEDFVQQCVVRASLDWADVVQRSAGIGGPSRELFSQR